MQNQQMKIRKHLGRALQVGAKISFATLGDNLKADVKLISDLKSFIEVVKEFTLETLFVCKIVTNASQMKNASASMKLVMKAQSENFAT